MARLIIIFLLVLSLNLGGNYYSKMDDIYAIDDMIQFIKDTVFVEEVNRKYLKVQQFYGRTDGALSYDFLQFIEDTLARFEVDKDITFSMMLALIDVESQFIHDRRSGVGAYGLCQIMPGTEKGVNAGYSKWFDGEYMNREDMYENVILSVVYLKDLLWRNKGNIEAVLRFYNGGTKWREKESTKNYFNAIVRKATKLDIYLYS